MEQLKVDRNVVIEKFAFLDTERLEVDETGDCVDVEALAGCDYDTLTETLCDGNYKPVEFYIRLIERWGEPDYTYYLRLSNEDDPLYIETYFGGNVSDSIFIHSKCTFKPSDIYHIIDSINSQSEFYDLLIAYECDDCVTKTLYHGESFSIYKNWIDDLMNKFRSGELDKYHHVTITSNFDDLCIESNGDEVEDMRLYVEFE